MREIHIGQLIKQKVAEQEIKMDRICNFLNCTEENVRKMFEQENCDTFILLRWSKLLEYDFFRIYTNHLILFAPCKTSHSQKKQSNALPIFRKNIYTQEIKDFILEKIDQKIMTTNEVIKKYNIPRTTLFTWIRKSKAE
jgi:hypothetical protein